MAGNEGLLNASREEGVIDLPMAVRAGFAKALIAERNGDEATALELLDKAVEAEKKQK